MHSLGIHTFQYVALHCCFVTEFKVGPFKLEYGDKLNFYLSDVDDLRRTVVDAPALDLLLYKSLQRNPHAFHRSDKQRAPCACRSMAFRCSRFN